MEDTQYNKKSVAIIGAGGMGREIASWFNQSSLTNEQILSGFLDDDPNALAGINCSYKVVGEINKENFANHDSLIIGIASAKFKKHILELSRANSNINIVNFIAEGVVLGENATLGTGVVVCPNCIISCNTSLAEGVFVNSGSQIGHDVSIGECSSLMASVNIGGGAQIGRNVFIGTGAVILPGVKVSDNIKIAAGAVVFRNLRKEGTYIGNPAMKLTY